MSTYKVSTDKHKLNLDKIPHKENTPQWGVNTKFLTPTEGETELNPHQDDVKPNIKDDSISDSKKYHGRSSE